MELSQDGITVELLADTTPKDKSFYNNARLVTLRVDIPKYIEAQLNTHKMISKNSQSSRAVPTDKVTEQVPVWIPSHIGINRRGMECIEYLDEEQTKWFQKHWLHLEQYISKYIYDIQKEANEKFGFAIEKGIINRPLDPFRKVKKILTGVANRKGWINFFALRCHSSAQKDIEIMARLAEKLFEQSKPKESNFHIPLSEGANNIVEALKLSAARCAAVSYRNDINSVKVADRIIDKLINSSPQHSSPFEHQGVTFKHFIKYFNEKHLVLRDIPLVEIQGNFYDSEWGQLRKLYDNPYGEQIDFTTIEKVWGNEYL